MLALTVSTFALLPTLPLLPTLARLPTLPLLPTWPLLKALTESPSSSFAPLAFSSSCMGCTISGSYGGMICNKHQPNSNNKVKQPRVKLYQWVVDMNEVQHSRSEGVAVLPT